MKIFVALAVVALAVAPLPASARSWETYSRDDQGYRQDHGRSYGHNGQGYGRRHDFNGQADGPGDYRCDAFWDRGRTDCDAGWRDQRPFAWRTDQRRSRYSSSSGYSGYSTSGYGYSTRPRGQGYDPTRGTAYYGAYGRPDLVYPGGGYGGGHAGHGRDPHRIDWCRATYRSYDSGSGYYRTYSGRLVFCG